MGGSAGLAFKAYEIEELVDVYFFRRLGYLVAHIARLCRLTPNTVSIAAALIGVVGGILLYWPHLALGGFALLVVHGIVDSADGQLARLTNRTSELGRILDGVSGYVTHMAIFLAIAFGSIAAGRSWWVMAAAVAAGVSAAVQAQMYDYHRDSYARCAIKGAIPSARAQRDVGDRAGIGGVLRRLAAAYESMQGRLAGAHRSVEAALSARGDAGEVRPGDRTRYREAFYWLVRGWNLLGDNVRRYAVGVLALVQHLDWLFLFILVPMNAVLVALWFWQYRTDRRFLARL